MSESNENLNEVFTVEFADSEVITVPIDDTLSNSGEAADAAAVGAALALKADKSELSAAITVNGQSADAQGVIIVTAADTKISDSDNTTVKAAIEAVDGKTAADIPMSSAAGAQTIAQAIGDAESMTAEDIPMSSGSETTVAQKISAVETVGNANSTAISTLQARTGADINMTADDTTKVADAINARVKTINGEPADDSGNVEVTHSLSADNLTSNASQTAMGEFARRTSGGAASIETGSAWMSTIRGNRVHIGYVPENLTMTLTTAPREEGQEPITATLDHDTFIEAASGSGTYNFVYTTSWSVNPATYGITISGTPVSGDQIVVSYTAEDAGTIIQSDPETFVATGWNLYNHDLTYAIGLKYKENATYRIAGNYTAVKFSATVDGTKTTITPADGVFTITSNGYIWVEGGDATTTEVFMTWNDWLDANDAPSEFEAYTESVIDMSDLFTGDGCPFPYGLMRTGEVRDEINFNTGIATSNVQRLSNSAENMAAAVASGLTYEYDTNYIYIERATPVEYDLDDYEGITGAYEVNDHGLEYFTETSIAVYAICIYGNNLKNKLERDVLTISAQSLTSGQKGQARTNIGAASADDVSTLNSNFATYKQSDSFTVSSGYDTRYLSSVSGYIQNGVLTVYVTVNSGLDAGWYNGISLNLPEKYRPNSTIYSTHRINSASDAGKSIYGILSSAGGLQFYISASFAADVPIMFVGPANG